MNFKKAPNISEIKTKEQLIPNDSCTTELFELRRTQKEILESHQTDHNTFQTLNTIRIPEIVA